MAGTVLLLHGSVTGDGTAVGRLRVFLNYSMALTTILLAAVVIWVSAAAISQDVERRRVQMTVVKPIRRLHLWAGRWLGLLLVIAVELFVAGLTTALCVQVQRRGEGLSRADRQAMDAEILVARRRFAPRVPAIEPQIWKEVDALYASGRVDPDAPRRDVFKELRIRRLAELASVAPGESRPWDFVLPANAVPALRGETAARPVPVRLRFRFSSAAWDRYRVNGRWLVVAPESGASVALPVSELYDGTHCLDVPAGALPRDGVLRLVFVNGARSESCTVVFPDDGPVELLAGEGAFMPNFARTYLVLFCHLALLAALGLTAGSLFSFPVATFCAIAVIGISLTGRYLAVAAAEGESLADYYPDGAGGAALIAAAGERLGIAIDALVRPALRVSVIGELSDGILVSWSFLAQTAAIVLVLYGGAFAVLGGICLSRRELALQG
jgi:hypothetical protein